jgi:hypothetical protein
LCRIQVATRQEHIMNHRIASPLGLLFAAIGFVIGALPASAQTSPSLLLKSWHEAPHIGDTYDEPIFINGGHTQDGEGIDLLVYDSYGRIKFDRNSSDPNIWLGYRAMTIGIDGDQPNLPGDLTDLSLAVAFNLGESSDNWRWSLALGAGTANDGHWSNTGAIYGIGTVNGTHRIDEDSAIDIGVNYDGNRTLLPDVPLPYAMYRRKLTEEFGFRVGLPYSGLSWNPLKELSIDLEYSFPTNLLANVSLNLDKHWSFFGEFTKQVDGFFINDVDNRRIFYQANRISGGVRFIKAPLIDIRAGVGFAMDQEFSSGFDIRDLNTIAKPSNELLFYFTVQGTF